MCCAWPRTLSCTSWRSSCSQQGIFCYSNGTLNTLLYKWSKRRTVLPTEHDLRWKRQTRFLSLPREAMSSLGTFSCSGLQIPSSHFGQWQGRQEMWPEASGGHQVGGADVEQTAPVNIYIQKLEQEVSFDLTSKLNWMDDHIKTASKGRAILKAQCFPWDKVSSSRTRYLPF